MIHFAEKILIAGHSSMEGLAIERQLLRLGHPKSHILHAPAVDFRWNDPHQVGQFLATTQPDQIYIPAKYFLQPRESDGLATLLCKGAIHNIICTAASAGINKLLLLVSSEVYPTSRLPPLAEEDLTGGFLSGQGSLDVLTQISAMKLCEEICASTAGEQALDYRCAVIGGVYGPGDDYSGRSLQPVPQVLKELENAKANALACANIALEEDATLDMLFVDDMAEAVVYLMEISRSALDEQRNKTHHQINIAHGEPVKAQKLVRSIANLLGYSGDIVFAKKNGMGLTPPRNLDPYRLSRLGWTPMMGIDQGVEILCTDFQLHRKNRHKVA